MITPSSKKTSPCLPFPYPKRFVVARLDPVGMLQDIKDPDPEALAEAQRMTPKKYIFYLNSVRLEFTFLAERS